ncbi:hypothetical protein FA13DRAFT_1733709 [Coprinellus micaceus]|uniref:Uncharacterized protein n=1 Tax=Coprinellus micaceus TaxID=71717 RepID=A0A4Y7T886_COPMI|nr:hypothetical protein FA13DRAFT_1733709 [Coprinellus micaceus]
MNALLGAIGHLPDCIHTMTFISPLDFRLLSFRDSLSVSRHCSPSFAIFPLSGLADIELGRRAHF